MNKKSWLIAGLSLVMAATLGVGISACGGGKDPDTPEHTHEYTKWQHNDTQHWMVCPDDDAIWAQGKVDHTFKDGECECGAKEGEKHTHDFTEWKHDETQHWMVCPTDGEIWEQGKVDHDFTNGDCVCGMENPDGGDETPDADLDTRLFYVVGSGAGDLKSCSFTELIPSFQLTKQPKKDENGYTVYKTAALTLYAGDTMKIVQDLKWDDAGGLGYFSVGSIKNNDGTFVDGGTGNISPATGKDGKYIFTVRTKPDITFAECTLEFELVEPVAALTKTEEIYIVGNLERYTTKWPAGTNASGCLKLNYDESAKEWSITLRLGGKATKSTGTTSVTDTFKLFNAVNGKYFPDGVNNNWTVSGTTDGKNRKASGDYKISWKTGDLDVTFTKLTHEHVYDCTERDDTQHWKMCWLDDEEEAGTRADHIWENDQDEKCDFCGQTRHVHKYTKQNKDATQHWMECPDDGAISPEGKTNHVYDQEGGTKCVCGAEKPDECLHDGEVSFEYTAETLPAGVADGGTITGKCEKCGNPVEVHYDKYLEFVNPSSAKVVPPAIIENDKTYYGKRTVATRADFSGTYTGYEIKAAGTLTVTMDVVCSWQNSALGTADWIMKYLLIDTTPLETGIKPTNFLNDIIAKGQWNSASSVTAKVAKWKEQITFDTELGSAFHSMTITFTQEDVGQYLYFLVAPSTSMITENSAFLFKTSFAPAAAASISAPAEVALLPEKKD